MMKYALSFLFLLGLFFGFFVYQNYENECKIKVSLRSRLYHDEFSPFYNALKDYKCFKNPQEAEMLGLQRYK